MATSMKRDPLTEGEKPQMEKSWDGGEPSTHPQQQVITEPRTASEDLQASRASVKVSREEESYC